MHNLPPGLPAGFEGIKLYYEAFWSAFPDAQLKVENLVAEGDKVACSFVVNATHTGHFMGTVPPTQRRITLTGITILRLRDGKCVERWSCYDTLSLMQQLGAIPSTEPAQT